MQVTLRCIAVLRAGARYCKCGTGCVGGTGYGRYGTGCNYDKILETQSVFIIIIINTLIRDQPRMVFMI